MFRQLARQLQEKKNDPMAAMRVFQFHPLALTAFLEQHWNQGRKASGFRNSPIAGMPFALEHLTQSIYDELCKDRVNDKTPAFCIPGRTTQWHHLIYAYMIENTGIVEIFRKVIFEYVHGEGLGTFSELDEAGHEWLRATEELFFRDTSPYFIHSLTSEIRPQIRATRRNAYYRMFGMDLNHGIDDKSPYPYHKAEASNNMFVTTLVELLREAWVGLMNAKNSSGANPTDDGTMMNLVQRLRDMLTLRRQGGNLAREEYFAVAAMSWFHLTIEFNSPIISALKATATSPGERLRKLRDRVKYEKNVSKADNFLELAEPLSRFLIAVESGVFSDIKLLYLPNLYATDLQVIINHWSQATGMDLKASRVKPI